MTHKTKITLNQEYSYAINKAISFDYKKYIDVYKDILGELEMNALMSKWYGLNESRNKCVAKIKNYNMSYSDSIYFK